MRRLVEARATTREVLGRTTPPQHHRAPHTQLGITVFARSCPINTNLCLEGAGDQFWSPNIVWAIGQALLITPISAIAPANIAPAHAGAASGLSNMMRNLGGAVCTATLATVLTKREQFHSNIIGQSVTPFREEVRQRLNVMTSYFMPHGVSDQATAARQAVVAVGASVRRQALIMGFSATFAVMGVLLAVAALALLFARETKNGSDESAR